MNVEIQKLLVLYKNEKLVYGKDYEIKDHELVFKKMINVKHLRVFWEIIHEHT